MNPQYGSHENNLNENCNKLFHFSERALQKANVSKEHSRYFLNSRQLRYTLELVEKAQR